MLVQADPVELTGDPDAAQVTRKSVTLVTKLIQ